MTKFRVVIRTVATSEKEYFVEAETNTDARAKAMSEHHSVDKPCIGLSTVTDIVSTKVVKAE